MMKKALVVFAIALNFHGFSQELTTFESENLSIEYPFTWELDQSGQMGTSFIIFSPIQIEGDTFRENVNLLIEDISGSGMNLTDYASVSEQQIQSIFGPIEESVRIGNKHMLVYNAVMGNFKLKLIQYLQISDSKAYVLTLTAARTEFDKYQEVGKKIMDSFQIN